jgi:nitrogen fixation/metabolism regulation signal transduction histidine kinase
MFKRFTILIIIRIVLLVANVLLLSWIFGDMRLFFNQVILTCILIGQVVELIWFVNHTNRELSRLFLSIRHSDFSVSFKNTKLGSSFKDLQDSLNEIIYAYKEVKIEKEAQYHFLQMLVNQIHIGIISLAQDEIVLINPHAEKLLGIDGIKNWKLVQQLNPTLAKEFEQIGQSGRKLVEVRVQGEVKILSVDVSTSNILGKTYQLITMQDVNSEIEQKEIEAWHKLIRILTHEIMNSVTPVSSLTETMLGMLTTREGQQKSKEDLTDETISDIRFSLSTIQKRSEGLLQFVEDYRKLTRVPKPVRENVNVKNYLDDIENLMREQMKRHGITLLISVEDQNLITPFDPHLMEQVIINLLTNSIHALEGQSTKKIMLKAYMRDATTTVIEVSDTGKGIPDKALKEIFIPFFSTKKDGSGIGLSLSKQIVSSHGGSIKVSSTPLEGTSFFIYLKK